MLENILVPNKDLFFFYYYQVMDIQKNYGLIKFEAILIRALDIYNVKSENLNSPLDMFTNFMRLFKQGELGTKKFGLITRACCLNGYSGIT